jgi:hypothetical protein
LQSLYKKVNLSLSAIERKLVAILKRFYNKYIRGSIDPVGIIKQRRGGYIWHQLAKAILQSFYVSESRIDRNRDIFKDLVDHQYEQFWITANKLRMREDELKTVPESQIVPAGTVPVAEKKSSFDVDAAMLGFAGWLSFAAFNTGILLLSLTNEIPEVVFMTVGDKKVDKKICKPLHGRTFFANDPACPRPPLHLFCRCMLLPSIS